jgi:hypothetical protein
MRRKYFPERGQRFGRLTVIDPEVRKIIPSKPGGLAAAVCRCDCGTVVRILLGSLFRSKATQSCGCLMREVSADQARTVLASNPARLEWARSAENAGHLRDWAVRHDLSHHPLYRVWNGMMSRCYRPSTNGYEDYGGLGVRVCERWHDPALFIADIEADIGARPDGRVGKMPAYSLDRYPDTAGNYEPGNVRWATWSEQRRNQRREEGPS